jgi:DNA-directed RNA polymerase specialized sigma subunit
VPLPSVEEERKLASQPNDSEGVRRVEEVVSDLEAVDDLVERFKQASALLKTWPAQQSRISDLRQAVVAELREQQVSYRKIARMLGVSPVRIQQIEKGLSGPNKPKRTHPTVPPEETPQG